MEVRLDRDLVRRVAFPDRGRRRVDEVAHPVDVQHEPFGCIGGGPAAEAGDHPAATLSKGGERAWQIATARASAAWCGVGSSGSARIIFTIRCICAFSARP